MSTSLSSLVDDLSEIYKKECESCKERKKIISECRYTGFMNNRIHYKCKECNDKLNKSINRLIEKFPNTYRFCNKELNKFVLLLRKGVYPHEYMNSWEKFDETLLPDKECTRSKSLESIQNKKLWQVS